MQRHRSIAAAPARGSATAWEVLAGLVADTLERSPHIDRSDVEAAMAQASGVGRMLIAGGHLEGSALTVIAGDMRAEINTVSGDAALGLEENLNPIPGAGTAEHWAVHLPPCDPLADLVKQAAKGHTNLSADEAPSQQGVKDASTSGVLDGDALRRWAQSGS